MHVAGDLALKLENVTGGRRKANLLGQFAKASAAHTR